MVKFFPLCTGKVSPVRQVERINPVTLPETSGIRVAPGNAGEYGYGNFRYEVENGINPYIDPNWPASLPVV